MSIRDHVILVADQYGAAKRLSRARVSTLAFKQGMALDRIASGANVTMGRLEAALRWFSANWPADTPWPASVPRPAPSDREVA